MDPIEFYELSRMTVFPYKRYPSKSGFHIGGEFFSLIFYQCIFYKKFHWIFLNGDPGINPG